MKLLMKLLVTFVMLSGGAMAQDLPSRWDELMASDWPKALEKSASTCILPIGTLGESEITTLEGIGTVEQPHPLQAAFIEEQAAQCGYCIPGIIMMAKALLDRKQQPSEAEIQLALASNLCRCGTHNRIVRAILKVAQPGGRI